MTDKNFDQIISQKLEGLNPPMEPNAWSLFEQKLDSTSSESLREDADDSFDQLIVQKLSGFESDYKPESWSQFERFLDASMNEEQQVSTFDDLIASNLQRYYPVYNHQHWLILKERLDRITFITNRVATYKAGEVAILLLLWFFISNIPNQYFSATDSNTDAIILKEEKASPIIANSTVELEEPVVKLEEVKPLKSSAKPIAVQSTSQNTNARLSVKSVLSTLEPNKTEATDKRVVASDKHIESEKSQLVLPLLHKKNSLLLTNEIWLENRFERTVADILDYNTGKLTPFELLELPMARLEKLPELSIDLPKQKDHKVEISFSMLGGLEYNRVITKEIKKYGLRAFDRYEAGYGGGFLVDFKRKGSRWGLQTGAIYSAKTIRPKQVTYLGSFKDGFPGEVLEEYDYNIINIPLNFTYDLLKNKKWRVYATGGVSLQFVYEANYYIVLDLSETQGLNTLGGPGGFISTASTKSRLDEINFPSGLFQDGSLKESGFLSTNLGIGVERKVLEDRWSVFMQPTYFHGLIYFNDGLGPFRDRIRTMSVFTGVRVRLVR